MTTLVAPFASAVLTYRLTSNWSWTGIIGVGVLLAIGLATVILRLVSVPIRMANEAFADIDERTAELEMVSASLEAHVEGTAYPTELSADDLRIFQGGVPRGTAIGVQIHGDTVMFDTLENTGGLDRADAFIFQDMILRIQRIEFLIDQLLQAGGPNGARTSHNVLGTVTCAVVGSTKSVRWPVGFT